jgi:hypothetical protein
VVQIHLLVERYQAPQLGHKQRVLLRYLDDSPFVVRQEPDAVLRKTQDPSVVLFHKMGGVSLER